MASALTRVYAVFFRRIIIRFVQMALAFAASLQGKDNLPDLAGKLLSPVRIF